MDLLKFQLAAALLPLPSFGGCNFGAQLKKPTRTTIWILISRLEITTTFYLDVRTFGVRTYSFSYLMTRPLWARQQEHGRHQNNIYNIYIQYIYCILCVCIYVVTYVRISWGGSLAFFVTPWYGPYSQVILQKGNSDSYCTFTFFEHMDCPKISFCSWFNRRLLCTTTVVPHFTMIPLLASFDKIICKSVRFPWHYDSLFESFSFHS